MYAIGPNQGIAFYRDGAAIASPEQRGNAAIGLAYLLERYVKMKRPLRQSAVDRVNQNLLQMCAMDRVLRNIIARRNPSAFLPHVLTMSRPEIGHFSPHPDLVEFRQQAQTIVNPDGMRQERQSHANLKEFGNLLIDFAFNSTFMEQQGSCKPANASACNYDLHRIILYEVGNSLLFDQGKSWARCLKRVIAPKPLCHRVNRKTSPLQRL